MAAPPPPLPRWAERAGGLGLVALGAWLLLSVQAQAARTGAFNAAGAAMGPFALVLGAGLLLFPSPRTERALRGAAPGTLSRRWAMLMGLAAALSAAHVAALLLS